MQVTITEAKKDSRIEYGKNNTTFIIIVHGPGFGPFAPPTVAEELMKGLMEVRSLHRSDLHTVFSSFGILQDIIHQY